jgi:hypothetical protein
LCCNFVIDFFKVNEVSELSPGDVISSMTLKIAEKRKRRKQPAEKKENKRKRVFLKKRRNVKE